MVVQGFPEMTREDESPGFPPAHIRVTHLATPLLALASYWSILTSQDHTDVTSTTTRAAHWIEMTSPVQDDVTRATSKNHPEG
jgi:hypothetical protein